MSPKMLDLLEVLEDDVERHTLLRRRCPCALGRMSAMVASALVPGPGLLAYAVHHIEVHNESPKNLRMFPAPPIPNDRRRS